MPNADCRTGNVLDELLKLLKLEKIEENIFRGQSQDLGFGNVFGGQVLGQALSAALQTVSASRHPHSLHAYFIWPGDATLPIAYTVDCIRNGKSFATRRVVALQKGRAIFFMSASFQIDEPGFDHQDAMPQVQGPEQLISDHERVRRLADRIPPDLREKLLCPRPIEIRNVNPMDPFAPTAQPPQKYVWMRAIDRMPDDPAIHRYMLAYASDFSLIATSLYPHGHTYWEKEMQVASLDHSMWFHRDFRMDQWLLFATHSPNAGKARGLSIGKVFTREGSLVATVAQEGLIRYRGQGKKA